MYKSLLRPFFFLFDPEQIHHLVFNLIKLVHRIPGVPSFTKALFTVKDPKLRRTVMGMDFRNPVGLAAGFDKDGKLYKELGYYGFGFIELGTVTPKPQPGNEKPRMFRLPADHGLINRMGFNNEGVDALVERLKDRKDDGIIIGGNIGKNKTTPNEKAVDDYLLCFDKLFDYVDYFVVNVSSPNTPQLRELQEKEPLKHILRSLQEENEQRHKPRPVLLKIAPDLTEEQLDDIVEIVEETGIAGIIATNTTISRKNLKTPEPRVREIGAGGVSGKPVKKASTEVVRYLSRKSGGRFPIIAVGGIFTPEDAREKLDAGASLVQVYTGFIYEGPRIVKSVCKAIF